MPDDGSERDETAEETAARRTSAYNATHYASWVWSESAVSWVPPIAWPSEDLSYLWDEPTRAWVRYYS